MIKKILLAILSFVIGFSSGASFKMMYESSSYQPYSWAKNTPPDIVNCYGPKFSKLQMTRAISYWTLRGYKFGDYVHSPSRSFCENEWVEGSIIVRKSSMRQFSESTLANTRRFTSFSRMRGSVISYRPGAFNLDLINEHELGHALGLTHIEVEGHIMHPLYHKMGRDFWIPAK